MNVKIYSKLGCPYCVKTEEVLHHIGVEPTVLILNEHFSKKDFKNLFGAGSTFPRVLIDDQLIGGAKETIEYLQENGRLS